MNEIAYEERLELKLIGEFKRLFYRKMGYEPVVISRNHKEIDPEKKGHSDLKPVNLRVLREWFEEITPFKNGARMPLDSKKRYREIVQVRMVYCFIARMMGHSLVRIARSISRDHSTIIHNVDTFKNLMETNPQIIELYKEIFQHVKQKLENYDPKLLECSNQAQDNDESALLP
jgi:hypothetical protein